MRRFWIGFGRWEAGRVPPVAWLALLLVFGAVYARCLGHGFVWDDFSNVVDRSHFEAPLLSSLLATQHDFMDRSLLHSAKIPVPYESYRPLLFLSYFLDDALFERGAAAMHAHNLLIAMLCVLLAGWVCTQMLGAARLGFAAAAASTSSASVIRPTGKAGSVVASVGCERALPAFGCANTLKVPVSSVVIRILSSFAEKDPPRIETVS